MIWLQSKGCLILRQSFLFSKRSDPQMNSNHQILGIKHDIRKVKELYEAIMPAQEGFALGSYNSTLL